MSTLPQLVYSPIYSSTAIYPYVADIGAQTMAFYSYDVGSDFLTISLKQQTDPSKGTGHAIVFDIADGVKNLILNAIQPSVLQSSVSNFYNNKLSK